MTLMALWFALQAGFMPNDYMVTYQAPPQVVVDDFPTGYIDLSAELRLFDNHVFVGGGIKTELQKSPIDVAFFPESSVYVFTAGLRLGGLELAWLHVCAHPTLPYLYQYDPVIHFERAYDDLYIRFSGTVPLLKATPHHSGSE